MFRRLCNHPHSGLGVLINSVHENASNASKLNTRKLLSDWRAIENIHLKQGCRLLTKTSFNTEKICSRAFRCSQRLENNGENDSASEDELTDVENDVDVELPDDGSLFDHHYMLPESGHRVFLLQPDDKSFPRSTQLSTAKHKMEEAQALVETLPNWKVVDKAIYSTRMPKKKAMFGKGNFEDISRHIAITKGVSAVFVGMDMLNIAQLQFLQNTWKLPVYDRYSIVLQIFQDHARTKEAKLQVALAEIPYIRSRLRGIKEGTLDHHKGGLHNIGGAGESSVERRHRLLQNREVKLKKMLSRVKAQRVILRSNRLKKEIPIVAVVGYTNSGKTTLIKTVSRDEKMEPRNQLFATLDVTAHGVSMPNKMKAVFMDTVGFISDIPTSLIESFSATLEDALIADVVVHVRDISHPDTEMQKIQVLETLRGLDLSEKVLSNIVEVCNKMDKLNSNQLELLKRTGARCISATRGTGVAELMHEVQEKILLNTDRIVKLFKVPMAGQHLSWLYKESSVQETKVCDDNKHIIVNTIITQSAYGKFKARFSRR